MRNRVTLLCLLLSMVLLRGAGSAPEPVQNWDEAQRVFEQANALYDEREYEGALDQYERLFRSGFATVQVLGNAGNAAFHAGDAGRAVLYYERALRLAPGNREIRNNLEAIQPRTNAIPDRSFGDLLAEAIRSTWLWPWVVAAELAFLWLLISLVMVARTVPGSSRRVAWWSRSAAAAVLFAVAAGLMTFHDHLRLSTADAVIVEDRTISRSGPGEDFFQQLELPAGTKLWLGSVPREGWVKFKLADGTSGYIRTDTIERI